MSSYRGAQRGRPKRPPGLWHDIPAGVRAAIICIGPLIAIFIGNGLGAGIFALTGFSMAYICYPVQLLAYVVNGIIAGQQADATRRAYVRYTGKPGERVQISLPNYIMHGALAGLCLTIFAAIVYFVGSSVLAELVPLADLIGFSTPWQFIVVDAVASISLGAVGGIIFDRMFAMPGRS